MPTDNDRGCLRPGPGAAKWRFGVLPPQRWSHSLAVGTPASHVASGGSILFGTSSVGPAVGIYPIPRPPSVSSRPGGTAWPMSTRSLPALERSRVAEVQGRRHHVDLISRNVCTDFQKSGNVLRPPGQPQCEALETPARRAGISFASTPLTADVTPNSKPVRSAFEKGSTCDEQRKNSYRAFADRIGAEYDAGRSSYHREDRGYDAHQSRR